MFFCGELGMDCHHACATSSTDRAGDIQAEGMQINYDSPMINLEQPERTTRSKQPRTALTDCDLHKQARELIHKHARQNRRAKTCKQAINPAGMQKPALHQPNRNETINPINQETNDLGQPSSANPASLPGHRTPGVLR